MYKITITKLVENPEYDKKEDEKSNWNRPFDERKTSKMIEVKALETELEDDEFQTVKQAVLNII